MLVHALALVSTVCVFAGCSGLAKTDATRFAEPEPGRITFWGHACTYIDVDGVGILTDPVFDKNLWTRRRIIGAPSGGLIERARIVLISHAHNDHLSPSTLKELHDDAIVLCPAPVAKILSEKKVKVKVMRPGDEFDLGGVRVVAVNAHHPGGRWSLKARADGRALGWVIAAPTATIYYTGDTDYCSSFAEVGQTHAPDIAIMNVSGHLKPADAARAARDTRAPVIIPTHWGAYTYWLFGGSRRPRGEEELKRLLGERLRVLDVGESLTIERSAARSGS